MSAIRFVVKMIVGTVLVVVTALITLVVLIILIAWGIAS